MLPLIKPVMVVRAPVLKQRRYFLMKELQKELRKYSNKKQAAILQRFFKTGPGEYGEGDVFIGVKVPQVRSVVKRHNGISLREATELLKSAIHEERLTALLILVSKYAKGDSSDKEKIYKLYLKNTRYINNWDLIDLTAHHIVGAFLADKAKRPIYTLANSKVLWERRIAVLSTFHYIKNDSFNDSLRIARILLNDREDLIHKAVGWMLREVGKRDLNAEEGFLRKHYKKMPRTMLRYAIERFPEPKRQAYLKG